MARAALREITAGTVRRVTDLVVAPAQRTLVAPNAVSLAQALFSEEAWYRAIVDADDSDLPVGFVMLYDETLRAAPPPAPAVILWRFMIDHRHQGRGLGAQAMAEVLSHLRRKGCFATLGTSYVPDAGNAWPFYRGLGFEPTGGVDEDGEIELTLRL